MMSVFNLHDATKRRALSSRETARSIQPVISATLANGNGGGNLTIDFAKMAVVTPSFFDELLRVIKDSVPSDSVRAPVIDLINTSAHQFARFRAVCRVHGMTTEEVGPDHWRISQA
jgi:hypothetical protein